MALKKKSILLSMAFLIGCFVCACGKEDSIVDESLVKDTEDVSSTEEMLHMVNHYMDEYLQTDSLVAKAKAEKYAKIILILSILVDTFSSRISLTMPPSPKPHNTACVLS